MIRQHEKPAMSTGKMLSSELRRNADCVGLAGERRSTGVRGALIFPRRSLLGRGAPFRTHDPMETAPFPPFREGRRRGTSRRGGQAREIVVLVRTHYVPTAVLRGRLATAAAVHGGEHLA